MTRFQCEKIKVMTLLCVLLMLYHHAIFPQTPDGVLGRESMIVFQNTLGGAIGRCAVPMFFMISGFLFFRTIKSLTGVLYKIIGRMRTLLIPYAIVAILVPITYIIVLALFPEIGKHMASYTKIENIKSMSLGDLLVSTFYRYGDTSKPIAFHLWYLRDLLMIILVSPILYPIKNWLKQDRVVAIAFILAFGYLHYMFPGHYFPFSSCAHFLFGALFLEKLSYKYNHVVGIIFVVLCIAQIITTGQFIWKELQFPIIILGTWTLWGLYDKVVPETFSLYNHRWLAQTCGYSFFIYLFHEPAFNLVRRGIVRLTEHTTWGFFLSFIASPWIMIALMVGIGIVLSRIAPYALHIITGGRSKKWKQAKTEQHNNVKETL